MLLPAVPTKAKVEVAKNGSSLLKNILKSFTKAELLLYWSPLVICDRRVSSKVKGYLYKIEVRPATLFGFETIQLIKKQKAKLEVAELKCFAFRWNSLRLCYGVMVRY